MKVMLLTIAALSALAPAQQNTQIASEEREVPLLSDAALEWLARDVVEELDEEARETVERWEQAGGRYDPPETYAGPEAFDPVGDWTTAGGFDGAQIYVRRSEGDTYSVLFRTSGCLGGWGLRRTATYENGVLTLDEPVAQYLPIAYDQLFAIRSEEGDFLVPGEGERYPAGLPAGGVCLGVTRDMRLLGLSRLSEEHVARIEALEQVQEIRRKTAPEAGPDGAEQMQPPGGGFP